MKILAVAAILLVGMAFSDTIQCNSYIELEKEDPSARFDMMSLEIVSIEGQARDTSRCTPDGNCFLVVYNVDQFILRMRGPSGAVYDPPQYTIDLSKG